jgi:Ribonuclease G/E
VPRRELLIAAGPGEWRAALAEDDAAVELFVERGEGAEMGSIHLGRIVQRLPALAALLVDIGGERPVFLAERDTIRHAKMPNEGERVLVQIRREAQGGKAARATMRLAPAEAVQRRLAGIRDAASRTNPPARLDPPATFAAALLGAMPIRPERIIVDEAWAVPEIRAALPDAVVAQQPEAGWPFDLDTVFAEALGAALALDGGGTVHIETARAAVLIDVDSGSPASGRPGQTALATDLAAARVVARELRLRQLGGGIVVDFVGLEGTRARDQVREALAQTLAPDPVPTRILGWTRLGHLELERVRRRRPLAEILLERRADGGLGKTAATVAHEAMRALRRAARAEPGHDWCLAVAPEVAAALAGPLASARREAEARLKRGFAVIAEPARVRDRFDIVAR